MKFDKIIETFKNDCNREIRDYNETVFIMACGYREKNDEIVTGVTIDKDAVNKIYGQENEKLDPIDIGVTITKLMLREAILKFKEYASSDGYKINESLNVTELTNKILLSIEDAVLVPKKK